MREVLQAIQTNMVAHQRHALFELLRDTHVDPEWRLAFAPSAAHYVLTLRDFCQHVLRAEPRRDRVQQLVNAQIDREVERAYTFAADLAQLGYDPVLPFNDALEQVRTSEMGRCRTRSYRLCRLALGATSLEKLALVHCIAATASLTVHHVMEAAASWAERNAQTLACLGITYDDASQCEVLSPEVAALLGDLQLPPGVLRELLHLVDRTFEYFTAFTDELLAAGGASVPSVERGAAHLCPPSSPSPGRPRVITLVRELRALTPPPRA
jgi:hypothetical protein